MTTYLASLQKSARHLLETNERVYFLGEDILDPYGGAFKVTKGLSNDFPGRVVTTPISEAAIVGVANGMALRGLLPIVEIMFGDFITLTADQIINHATKFSKMYHDQVNVPLVIRTPMGGGRGYGPTHSQSLEKIFFGIPHLHIIAPTQFHNPGYILEFATLEDKTPVLFIEHKLLYSTELISKNSSHLIMEEIHEESGYSTMVVNNFENAAPDVTVIAYGGSALLIYSLMEKLAGEEIRVTACFPSCIKPLPVETLTTLGAKSGRIVVVEEGTRSFGWGAEVTALLSENLWKQLKAPIKRIGAQDTIIPAAKPLEDIVLPSSEDIETAIFEVML